jgi:heat shock protein HslJ
VRTRRHGLLGSALLTVATLGVLGAPAALPVAAATTPLTGTNWVLTARSSFGTRLGAVTLTAQFGTDGALAGDAACNRYSTTYTTRSSRLSIANPTATTLASCGGRADRVATAYLATLGKVRSFSISGTRLTLRGRGGVSLVYRAASAGDLVGSWKVTSFFTGTAVTSPINGSTLTADFTREQISGNSGCNTYRGPYTASGTTIEIGPLASTLRACADAAVNTQEQQFLAALQLATGYSVAGDQLDLLRTGGTIAATLTRER